MVIALIILALVVLILCIQLIRYERELRRMAQFLESRDSSGNTSPTINVHSRSMTRLARAIHTEIEDSRAERLKSQQHQRRLQAGLVHLSHDIRTPLAGAQGYIQLMDDEANQAERIRYLQAVTRRLNDLNHLLEQLFMFSQVSEPEYQLELEQVDATACLSDALLSFYPQFQEKGIEPVVTLDDERCIVVTDREALSRIMRNLLANALRHGSGAIAIYQQGNAFTFTNSVESTDELDVERIFDRFYKSDATRSGEGSGLGLAIVKLLAEATGASVRAEIVDNTIHFVVSLATAPTLERQ